MKGFLFVLREFIVCVALMTAGILAAALIADWYITEVRGHVYEAPATESGDTGYYSSPHVTRPAMIDGYDMCPLIVKKKDGTYYAKVTVCHRA